MRQDTKLNHKPSLLSKEEVIWLNCLIVALFVSKLGLGSYSFANEQIERFSILVLALLIVFVAVVVFFGPKSIVRTISMVVAIPVAMLALLGGCAAATNFDEYPDQVELAAQVGDVSFELVTTYDITYDKICKQWLELRMHRPVLDGILKEQRTLIIVHPAFSATTELIDHGKNIRFSSPALLGRKAITRTYSTDWDKARKNSYESIDLTPAEQKATGVFNSSNIIKVSSAAK